MSRFLFAVIFSLMSMTAPAKSIVVWGDSISAGYGIKVAQGWGILLQEKLDEKDAEFIIHIGSISVNTAAGG